MKKFFFTLAVIFLATLINFCGSKIAGHIAFPLFMDSIATIAVAALCGTLPAIIVAVLSNGLLAIFATTALPFLLCHVMTALFAGMIFRAEKNKSGRLFVETFMWAGLASAISNSALGDTFSLLLFYGDTNIPQIDNTVQGIFIATQNMPFAIYWGGTLANLIDKILCALFSFAVYFFAANEEKAESRPPIKTVFKIEYIFLFIAIANLIATGIFKKLAAEYFVSNAVERALENRVRFGFDCMIYSSIILIFIIIVLALFKYFSQRETLSRMKMQTEIQEKISRDIHDGILQNLGAMEFQLRNNKTERALFYAKEAINDVRFLCGSLKLDLTKDMADLVQEELDLFEKNYNLRTLFYNASDEIKKISDNAKLEIFRIITELLSNAARHSNAEYVSVKIVDAGNFINIKIEDNGKGFDFEAASKKQNHHGIENTTSRAKSLGGTIKWDTKKGGGTSISIKLPFAMGGV